MKRLFFYSFVFLLLLGCSKDDDCPAPIPPTYQVQGYYVGKYGSGVNEPNSGFSMVVEADGKMMVADGASLSIASKASGTYTLVGNVFKATYTYNTPGGSTFSIQANYDSSTGKFTSGTWGSGANYTGSGTWFMDRKN
ncbi:hypothetical protein [Flavobacterium sp.]|uniref:hypothetical protein n=1 Tax=Flavobacterium sp. TaxID=239 RepID=UPI003D152493